MRLASHDEDSLIDAALKKPAARVARNRAAPTSVSAGAASAGSSGQESQACANRIGTAQRGSQEIQFFTTPMYTKSSFPSCQQAMFRHRSRRAASNALTILLHRGSQAHHLLRWAVVDLLLLRDLQNRRSEEADLSSVAQRSSFSTHASNSLPLIHCEEPLDDACHF